MIYRFAGVASILLATTFFMSCSLLSPKNQPSDSSSLNREDIEQKIAALSRNIVSDSSNAELFFQKGKLLYELAQYESSAEKKLPLFNQMRTAFNRALQLSDQDGDHSFPRDEIDEVLKVSWSHEHNQGVQILQTDTPAQNSGFKKAVAHFSNAIAIIPDSAVSYNMKARTLYYIQDTEGAITTLEKAREVIPSPPSALNERLAFLYMETDRADKAADIYRLIHKQEPENESYMHGLVNAYIALEDHYKAVEILEILLERHPENIIYRQSIGTELYAMAQELLDDYSKNKAAGAPATEEKILALLKDSEHYFSTALEKTPGNEELRETAAAFYHNAASKLIDVKENTESGYLPEIDKQIHDYLMKEIELLESLVEEYPDRTEFWRNLHFAYSYLEMNDKASQIEEKINQ